MLQELITLENRFRPFLRGRDYTFIGPQDESLLEPFIKRANDIAPVVAFSRSIHHALSNQNAARRALTIFPAGTPLRIFVVTVNMNDSILLHSDIQTYCERNNINFQ